MGEVLSARSIYLALCEKIISIQERDPLKQINTSCCCFTNKTYCYKPQIFKNFLVSLPLILAQLSRRSAQSTKPPFLSRLIKQWKWNKTSKQVLDSKYLSVTILPEIQTVVQLLKAAGNIFVEAKYYLILTSCLIQRPLKTVEYSNVDISSRDWTKLGTTFPNDFYMCLEPAAFFREAGQYPGQWITLSWISSLSHKRV